MTVAELPDALIVEVLRRHLQQLEDHSPEAMEFIRGTTSDYTALTHYEVSHTSKLDQSVCSADSGWATRRRHFSSKFRRVCRRWRGVHDAHLVVAVPAAAPRCVGDDLIEWYPGAGGDEQGCISEYAFLDERYRAGNKRNDVRKVFKDIMVLQLTTGQQQGLAHRFPNVRLVDVRRLMMRQEAARMHIDAVRKHVTRRRLRDNPNDRGSLSPGGDWHWCECHRHPSGVGDCPTYAACSFSQLLQWVAISFPLVTHLYCRLSYKDPMCREHLLYDCNVCRQPQCC